MDRINTDDLAAGIGGVGDGDGCGGIGCWGVGAAAFYLVIAAIRLRLRLRIYTNGVVGAVEHSIKCLYRKLLGQGALAAGRNRIEVYEKIKRIAAGAVNFGIKPAVGRCRSIGRIHCGVLALPGVGGDLR